MSSLLIKISRINPGDKDYCVTYKREASVMDTILLQDLRDGVKLLYLKHQAAALEIPIATQKSAKALVEVCNCTPVLIKTETTAKVYVSVISYSAKSANQHHRTGKRFPNSGHPHKPWTVIGMVFKKKPVLSKTTLLK